MPESPSKFSAFIAELKRRRVFRVAAVYAGVAFIISEIVANTFEPLGIPDGFDTAVIVLLILGFPIVIALAWAFDITDEGIMRTKGRPANAKQKAQQLIGKRLREHLTAKNIILTALFSLLLVLSFQFVVTNVSGANIFGFSRAFAGESRRTAILEFEARSTDLDPILLQACRSELYKALQKYYGLELIGDYEIGRLDTRDLSRWDICDQLNTNYLITCSLLRTNGDYLVDSELYQRDQDYLVTHFSQYIPSLTLQETSRLIADSLSRHFADMLGITPRATVVDLSPPAEEGTELFRLFRKQPAAEIQIDKEAVAYDDDVYRVLVEGQRLLTLETLEDNLDAIVLIEEALLTDSANIDLQVALADAYYQRAQLPGGVAELAAKAEELAAAAIASSTISDEALATAYYLLSNIQLSRNELDNALESISTAMRLNRSDSRIRAHFKSIKNLLMEKMAVS